MEKVILGKYIDLNNSKILKIHAVKSLWQNLSNYYCYVCLKWYPYIDAKFNITCYASRNHWRFSINLRYIPPFQPQVLLSSSILGTFTYSHPFLIFDTYYPISSFQRHVDWLGEMQKIHISGILFKQLEIILIKIKSFLWESWKNVYSISNGMYKPFYKCSKKFVSNTIKICC